jgi:2-polyprenyl-3-methyl-5-hydroxy-6-metoxy-1,4-benzoquinol methylase
MTEHNSFDYETIQSLPETQLRLEVLGARLQFLYDGSPRILEVGLGSGDVTLLLAGLSDNLTSVDNNQKQIDLVNRRLKGEGLSSVEIISSTIEDFPLSPEGYDGIVLLNMLEHLKDPVSVLKHLSGGLLPGGAIHVTVPLAGSLHRWLGVEMGMLSDIEELADSDIQYGHHRVYTPESLREHVTQAGLRIQFEQPLYLKPLPTASLTPLPMDLHKALDGLARRFPEFASYMYLEAAL